MPSRPTNEPTLREKLLALRAYARSRMSDQLLALESPSDIVQSVCEDLLRSEPSREQTSAREDLGLLRQMVRWKIQERRRHWLRNKRAEPRPASPAEPPSLERGPSTTAVLREWLRELRAGVEQLPPRQREAIRMFYLDSRPMAEVGAALGCSEDAAKMLVSRAMQSLRQMRDR